MKKTIFIRKEEIKETEEKIAKCLETLYFLEDWFNYEDCENISKCIEELQEIEVEESCCIDFKESDKND